VEAPLAGHAVLGLGHEPDLLVVADRARRSARELRDLADPEEPFACSGRGAHALWCAGRMSDTKAPTSETAASTHSAVCMFEMKGASWAFERPLASPEKILKRMVVGTAEVTMAMTNAIEITAPVFCSITRAPAAIPRRSTATVPIMAAVFGLLNMPEPMPTTASQRALMA